jgi:hypothetical protein
MDDLAQYHEITLLAACAGTGAEVPRHVVNYTDAQIGARLSALFSKGAHRGVVPLVRAIGAAQSRDDGASARVIVV